MDAVDRLAELVGLWAIAPADPKAQQPQKRIRVPLQKVHVQGEIRGHLAQVRITQTYMNADDHHLDCEYVFPMDDKAAVCGFEACIGTRVVVGRVKEKEKAREEYTAAVAQGHGAYLMEEQTGDVIKLNIGNLPPEQTAQVSITYVQSVHAQNSTLRFVLPSVVLPRYESANADVKANVNAALPQQQRQRPQKRRRVRNVGHNLDAVSLNTANPAYTLTVSIASAMPTPLKTISSPSHEIKTAFSDDKLQADTHLVHPTPLNRDFVLLLELSPLSVPTSLLERHPLHNSLACCFSFQPDLLRHVPAASRSKKTSAQLNTEIFILLDRSGSMSGGRISQARDTLLGIIKALPNNITFNIFGFGSCFESLFPKAVPTTKSNIAKAMKHAATVQADLGGTELLAPVRAINRDPPRATHSRQLFIITDGQVGNTDAVLNEVSCNSHHTRVFAFGIGDSVSTALVNGLAEMGGGCAEFATSKEDLQPLVLLQLKRAMQPALLNLSIDWKGLDVQQAPARLRPVFHGDWYQVFAIFPPRHGEDEKQHEHRVRRAAFTLTGVLSDGSPVVFPLRISSSLTSVAALVHRIAGKVMIREAEAALASAPPEAQRKALESRIIRHAKDYTLLSQYTSFIAVEDRPVEQRNVATAKKRKLKVPQHPSVNYSSAGAAPQTRSQTLQAKLLRPQKRRKSGRKGTTQPLLSPFGVVAGPLSTASSNQLLQRCGLYPSAFSVGLHAPVAPDWGCWLSSCVYLLAAMPELDAHCELALLHGPRLSSSVRYSLWITLARVLMSWKRGSPQSALQQRMEQATECFRHAGFDTKQRAHSLHIVLQLIASQYLRWCHHQGATPVFDLTVDASSAPRSAFRYTIALAHPGLAFSLSKRRVRAWLALEDWRMVDGSNATHSSCLCVDSAGTWLLDDTLRLGAHCHQGGLIHPHQQYVLKHYQERVPVVLLHN